MIPQEADLCRNVFAGLTLHTRRPHVFMLGKTSTLWFLACVQGLAGASIDNNLPITGIAGASEVLTSFSLRLINYLSDLAI